HAAAVFRAGWPPLRAINVKLTMRLGIGAGLLGFGRTTGRQTGLVIARGGVGMPVRALRANRSAPAREGFLRALPAIKPLLRDRFPGESRIPDGCGRISSR